MNKHTVLSGLIFVLITALVLFASSQFQGTVCQLTSADTLSNL